jgi:predicted ribosomally synthesized peptide with SipW-like signal peptide
MRKLLFSFLVLGITSVLAIGATTAYFSDTEISSGNTFTAGTLQLDVNGVSVANESYTFSNIKPGDSAGWEGVTSPWVPGLKWTVKNTGSLDGTLTVSVDSIEDKYWDQTSVALDVNGIPESLILADVGDPKLSTQLRPQVRVNGTWKAESSGLHNLEPFTIGLASGEEVTILIVWSFSDTVGNEYQGANSTVDFEFHLEQN